MELVNKADEDGDEAAYDVGKSVSASHTANIVRNGRRVHRQPDIGQSILYNAHA